MTDIQVKALEWKVLTQGFSLERAHCLLGDYRIWKEDDGSWLWALNERGSDGSNDTSDEAKAAAQQHFNEKILSQIITPEN